MKALNHTLFKVLNRSKLKRYRERQTPRETVRAHVEMTGKGASVHVGSMSFFVGSDDIHIPDRDVYDFALYGIAPLAMSANIEVVFTSPVSATAAENVRDWTRMYDLFAMPRHAPLRLHCDHVIDDPVYDRKGTVICMSGGIDSTGAALLTNTKQGLDHGILIAGADYPDAKSPGFIEVKERVKKQADFFGIPLSVIHSSLAQTRVSYARFHVYNLGMSLAYVSPRFAQGVYAADHSAIEDLVSHPTANTHVMQQLFSMSYFPIIVSGAEMGRTDKLRLICERTPELVDDLAICIETKHSADNCGQCDKCIRTRMNFIAAGYPSAGKFMSHPSIVDYLRKKEIPAKFSSVRTEMVFMTDILHRLPDGDIKDELGRYVRQLKETYVEQMPVVW